MRPRELRKILREHAIEYAQKREIKVDTSHKTALIFKNIKDNFIHESFIEIEKNNSWVKRLQKRHPNVKGALEMASSNSSDALLMNIFCYPKIGAWKGILELLQVNQFNPEFGFEAKLTKKDGKTDNTEIDMIIDDLLFEAKLTEEDFTRKSSKVVHKYEGFFKYFNVKSLLCNNGSYTNYQIIRNLLAAIQWNKRHILLCDERRSDLLRQYYETVSCLKEASLREKCKVIFWQEIQRKPGAELKEFLSEKYGIS